jgi:hypothetical protein
MKKVALEKPKDITRLSFWYSSAPPFAKNKLGLLVHRVRYIAGYNLHRRPHVAVGYWCGAHSMDHPGTSRFKGEKLTLLAKPPKDYIVCINCERAAHRVGLSSAQDLAGRPVRVGKVCDYRKCCKPKVKK